MKKSVLVLALVLIFSTVALGASIEEAVDANRAEQISVTQEFVKIEAYNGITPTYSGPYPVEGVVDSLNYILDKAEEMGFKTIRHEWVEAALVRGPLYGYVEFGPEDAPEMIMALSHVDTVPPGNPALWTLAGPYEAKIVKVDGEDHIIGRGVFDDKGPAMASLYSLKAIKESGIPLNRRIRLFFGTTEDFGGWRCVSAYAAEAVVGREEFPVFGFSPDTGSFQPTFIEKTSVNVMVNQSIAPVGDKVSLTYLDGGTATNAVSDNCIATLEGTPADLNTVKADLDAAIAQKGWGTDPSMPIIIKIDGSKLTIDITGRAAHSGWAYQGIGANNRMMYLLSKVSFNEDWRNIAQKVTPLLPPDENDAATMGSALGINEGTEVNGDTVTVCLGLARLIPDSVIYLHVNIRYAGNGADQLVSEVKHQSGQDILAKVRDKFNATGLAFTTSGGGVPYTVGTDTEIMIKLTQAYKDITGITVKPCITPGGTYAAAWAGSIDPKTNQAFGPRMVSWGIEGGIGMHEANESMSVEKMIDGTKVMALAMASLSATTADDGLVQFMYNAPSNDEPVAPNSFVNFRVYVDLDTYPEGSSVTVYPTSLGWFASNVKAVPAGTVTLASSGYFDVAGVAPSEPAEYSFYFTIRDKDNVLCESKQYSFTVESGSGGSRNSGCDARVAGLAAFALVLPLFLRKKG